MQAWKTFLEQQEADLGAETVEKWLKPLAVVHFDAGNLYLEAQNAFQTLWFEEHIRPKVLQQLYNNNKNKIHVHLSVANTPAKVKKQTKKKPEAPPAKPAFELNFDALDPHYTFEQFVVSEANQFAYKLLSQICTGQKGADTLQLNPIYIYGNPGTGKTHLLMAAAAALKQQGIHAFYSHTQTFTDHVVSAIRAGEMHLFRQAYRTNDVLIIDDVHVLSRKGATQEEFFHTFNTLHLSGKQIILSSNIPPRELQQIEPRLVSRFEWGIVVPLEPPSKSDMEKILLMKAEEMNFPLHPKVVLFLLESFPSLTSLNKAFNALILRCHLQTRENALTTQSVGQLLADLIKEEQKSALTAERIVKGVAEFYGIRPEDILGTSQKRECVLPRQISMHFCRQKLKMPYEKIGDLFSKNHSTVMSSVKLVQKALDSEEKRDPACLPLH